MAESVGTEASSGVVRTEITAAGGLGDDALRAEEGRQTLLALGGLKLWVRVAEMVAIRLTIGKDCALGRKMHVRLHSLRVKSKRI